MFGSIFQILIPNTHFSSCLVCYCIIFSIGTVWAIFWTVASSVLRRRLPFRPFPSPATFPRVFSAGVCVGTLLFAPIWFFWFAESEDLAVCWVHLHELLLSDLLLTWTLLHLRPPIYFPLTQTGFFWPEKLEASPTHELRPSVLYPFCPIHFAPPTTILVTLRCFLFDLLSISDFVLFLCRFKRGTIHASIWSFFIQFELVYVLWFRIRFRKIFGLFALWCTCD